MWLDRHSLRPRLRRGLRRRRWRRTFVWFDWHSFLGQGSPPDAEFLWAWQLAPNDLTLIDCVSSPVQGQCYACTGLPPVFRQGSHL